MLVSPGNEELTEESSVVDDGKVSPLNQGSSKLSSLSIEVKKGNITLKKFRYQLWANTITLAIGNFITAIDPRESQSGNQMFTKDDRFS